eukprot:comp26185_c0_seq1/m.47076 comp26185_c0_seq1/g.47076  ORF comp26185_c0_seq1/g.47076 comp26185_c0_seq1/m.47076 type:complete len:523 (-) comp26185_c0_seq1:699-2267(-)
MPGPRIDSQRMSEPTSAPRDRFAITKASFFLQGFGCILPWNAFLTITSYWSWKLMGSRFYGNYMNYYIFLYTGLALITTFSVARFQHLVSLRARILVPQAALILCYLLFLTFVHIDAEKGDLFFFITILMLSLSSVASGSYEACLFTVISVLPPIYTTFALSGEASSGVIVAWLNFFSILFAPDIRGAATIYFGIALFALCVCCFNYVILSRSKVVMYYFSRTEEVGSTNVVTKTEEKAEEKLKETKQVGRETPYDGVVYDLGTPIGSQGHEPEFTEAASNNHTEQGNVSWLDYFYVLKSVGLVYYSCFLLCFITLAIYPTVPGSIAPVGSFGGSLNSKFYTSLWGSISVYIPYTTCDFLVRLVAGRVQLKPMVIAIGSTLRVGFLPVFLLCNSRCWDYDQGVYVPSVMPKVFMHDALPIIFVMVFALSHGFFLFQTVLVTPTLVEGKLRPVATSMCVGFMVLGCLLGSLASFGVRALNCGMNPFASYLQSCNGHVSGYFKISWTTGNWLLSVTSLVYLIGM